MPSYSTKKKDEVFVFDYGALCSDKLTSIVGDVTVLRGALLSGHKLVFAGKSKMFWDSSVASAVSNKKESEEALDLLGLVYKIKDVQLELLDLFMECHLGLMRRVETTVSDGHDTYHVYMYVLQDPTSPTRPVHPMYEELHKTLVREAYELYRKRNFPGS